LSQIIGFLNKDSCYICVDSNILYLDNKTSKVNKLFVAKDFIIATAGLSFGIDILEGFIEKSKNLEIKSFEEIEEYVLNIGNRQYRNFISNFEKILKKEFLRIYFLYAARKSSSELVMGLLGAEGSENIKKIEIKNIITAPRRLSIEMAMLKLMGAEETILVNFFKESMIKIATLDKNVSAPFRLGIIDKNGKTSYKLLD
jgi:hypothetical protein